MNPCIKTGFRFLDANTRTVRTGDLKLGDEGLFVTGIHPVAETASAAIMGHTDATVAGITGYLLAHPSSIYLRTNDGIELTKVTASFAAFIRQWSPQALDYLPDDNVPLSAAVAAVDQVGDFAIASADRIKSLARDTALIQAGTECLTECKRLLEAGDEKGGHVAHVCFEMIEALRDPAQVAETKAAQAAEAALRG